MVFVLLDLVVLILCLLFVVEGCFLIDEVLFVLMFLAFLFRRTSRRRRDLFVVMFICFVYWKWMFNVVFVVMIVGVVFFGFNIVK